MTLPLFIYGSLRDPGVRARLLGERTDLTTCPAVLHGHDRQMVPSFGYPFVVPAAPDATVDGELLLGLQQADYEILDEYEDVDDGLYVRARVTVQTPDGPVTGLGLPQRPGPSLRLRLTARAPAVALPDQVQPQPHQLQQRPHDVVDAGPFGLAGRTRQVGHPDLGDAVAGPAP